MADPPERCHKCSGGTLEEPLRALVDGHHLALRGTGVLATRANQTATFELLFDVGDVPCGAGGAEDAREEVWSDAERVVQPRRVVVDVRIQAEPLGRNHTHLLLDLGNPPLANTFGDLARQLLQDARAWIPRLVDGVSHAREPQLRPRPLFATRRQVPL